MILEFFPPKKTDILFYDLNLAFRLAKVLNIKNFSVLHTRKEILNIYILIKSFLKFRFSFFNYLQEYVDYCSPKILITFTDNDSRFYKLTCKSGLKIFIQNGKRTKMDIFYYLKKKIDNYVDYMFVHNKSIGNKYSKFIKGKTIPIGSIWSNQNLIKKSFKKNFLYISTFRPGYLSKTKKVFKNIFFRDYIKNEITLLKLILKFCNLNKIKLEILGKYYNFLDHSKEEFSFYKKLLGENIIFLPNSLKRNVFSILDQKQIIIGIDSTLAYEALARNKKVAFFSARGCKNSILKSRSFAWPYKIKSAGFFWTNKITYFEVKRILNNLLKVNKVRWNKISNVKFRDNIMCFDYKNKKIKSILRQLINN